MSALIERAPREVEIIALGRPQLDLGVRNAVLAGLRHTRCDAIVNAAAYTAVDKAESEPDIAMRINGEGGGHVAEAAAELGVPPLHLSTDYSIRRNARPPLREDDPTGPTGAYGRSKLAGEQKIAAAHPNRAVLRTAWVYSAFRHQFRENDAAPGQKRARGWRRRRSVRQADKRARHCGRSFRHRTPSRDATPRPTCAEFSISPGRETRHGRMSRKRPSQVAAQQGRKPVRVKRITTADYPTPARRPANSRLDNAKLQIRFGVTLPPWRQSLRNCVIRLLEAAK